MIPYFKDGNYSKGILQGYKAAAAKIAQGYNTELSGVNIRLPLPNRKKIQALAWMICCLLWE